MIRAVFIALLLVATAAGQQAWIVDEPITLKNYPEAPVQFLNLTVDSRTIESDEWMQICVSFDVTLDSERPFNSLSFYVADQTGRMLIGATSYPVNGRLSECFSNNVNRDDGAFIIRPVFVEDTVNHRTVWESREHREEVEQMFRIVPTTRRQRRLPHPKPGNATQ
jgi:hypothetical protein